MVSGTPAFGSRPSPTTVPAGTGLGRLTRKLEMSDRREDFPKLVGKRRDARGDTQGVTTSQEQVKS